MQHLIRVLIFREIPHMCFVYLQQLETELRKLQSVIQEGMAGFDDMLSAF